MFQTVKEKQMKMVMYEMKEPVKREGVVFDRQQNWIYCKTLKESLMLTLPSVQKKAEKRSESNVTLEIGSKICCDHFNHLNEGLSDIAFAS